MSQEIPCDGPNCSCRDTDCVDAKCKDRVRQYLNYLTQRYFRFRLG